MRRPGLALISKACSNQWVIGPGVAWVSLRRAGDLLREAGAETDRARRYGLCRLSALNSAWAACAAAVGERGSAAAADPWALLAAVRPGLAEWVPVFAAVELRWATVRRGVRPGDRELDDLLREATAFRGLVVAVVGRGSAVRAHAVRDQRLRAVAPLP